MSTLHLTSREINAIVSANHSNPRSVLGFHEIKQKNKTIWIIRVMEPEADTVSMFWEDQTQLEAQPLTQIHSNGLFEIHFQPRPSIMPYRLHIRYLDGSENVRHDPFYFSPQLTDYDGYLFKEGTHHQIYRKLGAHLINLEGVEGTLFAVWAPNAKRVSVVGDFNHWDGRKYPMQNRGENGIWELFIPGVGRGSVYKFEIKTKDGSLNLKTDPYGFASELRPASASVVTALDQYSWNDEEWIKKREQTNPLEQPINIYEVHLGSWKRVPEAQNRFLTYLEFVEQLIPYVKAMGYTHIELLPLAEHPLDRSWGYQVTGYYALTSRFGPPEDLMYFIDQCHQTGIGVILDWVPGHFPKDSHGLIQFDGTALYEHEDVRKGEHKEWGTCVFNYGRNEVRNFLLSNALFWFDYYHIDGIRVDAVASMLYLDYNREEGEWVPNCYGGNENLEAIHFLRQLNETLFHYHPGILSIAEESTSWPGISHPTYSGGLGFNLKWNMGWMNDTLKYIQLDPVFRKYDHHLVTFSLIYSFSENFLLPVSHDEVVHGKKSLLGKMPGDFWQQRANYRLYLLFQFAHPGKQLLFMGSEFGQGGEWNADQSLDWHLMEIEAHQQLHFYCKTLNHFYLKHSTLFTNDFDPTGFEWIDLHDQNHNIFSFMRWKKNHQDSPLIFVFNFSPVPRSQYQIGVPRSGIYKKIFDSDAAQFGGSSYNNQDSINSSSISWQGQPCQIRLDLPPLGGITLYQES